MADGPTHAEVIQACKDAGYGKELPADYSDSTPVTIRVGSIVGVMPRWMAEIYGHIGREEETADGNNTTAPER